MNENDLKKVMLLIEKRRTYNYARQRLRETLELPANESLRLDCMRAALMLVPEAVYDGVAKTLRLALRDQSVEVRKQLELLGVELVEPERGSPEGVGIRRTTPKPQKRIRVQG